MREHLILVLNKVVSESFKFELVLEEVISQVNEDKQIGFYPLEQCLYSFHLDVLLVDFLGSLAFQPCEVQLIDLLSVRRIFNFGRVQKENLLQT